MSATAASDLGCVQTADAIESKTKEKPVTMIFLQRKAATQAIADERRLEQLTSATIPLKVSSNNA